MEKMGQDVIQPDQCDARIDGAKRTLSRRLLSHRLAISRLILIVAIPVILFTRHSFSEDALIDYIMEIAGPGLIILGGLGRIWSILYISGKKHKQLVTTGPYSMVRHPLYFFSGMLCLGVVAALENVLILIVTVPAFALYYFAVILNEERRLREEFGAEYQRYCARTPRLLPAIWHYRSGSEEAGLITIEERAVVRTIRESALFMLLIPTATAINILHDMGTLPAFAVF